MFISKNLFITLLVFAFALLCIVAILLLKFVKSDDQKEKEKLVIILKVLVPIMLCIFALCIAMVAAFNF